MSEFKLSAAVLAACVLTLATAPGYAQDAARQMPDANWQSQTNDVPADLQNAPPSAEDMAESLPDQIKVGDITYTTGGVGADERAALDSVKGQYNLYLTSARTDGPFVSDAHLQVTNQKKAVVLDAYMGPILLAKLPAGTYRLIASYQGQTRDETVTVSEKVAKPVRFGWK